MFRSMLLSIVLLGVLINPVLAGPLEEGWKKVKDSEGIQVYTRPVIGLPMDEFMSIGNVNAPVTVVGEVWRDFPSYVQWFGDAKEFRIVKTYTKEKDKWVAYFVYQTPPWALGVKCRDGIVDLIADDRTATEAEGVLTTHVIKENLVPDNSKYVRMPVFDCRVVLTKVSDNVTRVMYTVKADPGGFMPGKVVEFVIVSQPFKTIQGLRKMVDKDVYWQKAQVRHPEVKLTK